MWLNIFQTVNRIKPYHSLLQLTNKRLYLNTYTYKRYSKLFIQKHYPNLYCGCTIYNHFNLLENKQQKFLRNNSLYTSNVANQSGDRHHERISVLFPDPKQVLNSYYAMVSNELKIQNALIIQYKIQGTKKGNKPDWACSYTVHWPKEMKIMANGLNKAEASRKCALKLLCVLDEMGKLLKNGQPVLYDQEAFNQITKNTYTTLTLNENNTKGMLEICHTYNKYMKHQVEKELQKEQQLLQVSNENVEDVVWRKKDEAVINNNIKYKTVETMKLPIQDFRNKIEQLVENNRVVIVRGEPGCGKSSYIPQYILEYWSHNHPDVTPRIVVTQPRRIAAISLAENVANERKEYPGQVVGYQVRLRSRYNEETTRILYCTTGVLLRWLQRDLSLSNCSHVIIDEAHERDVNTDLLLYLLKEALKFNPQLKLLVMSATVDSDLFSKYFEDAPVIHIRGRTFPVTKFDLDDIEEKFNIDLNRIRQMSESDRTDIIIDEVADVLHCIHNNAEEGAILCFLPGWDEISRIRHQLIQRPDLRSAVVLPLHGRLSNDEQRKIFESVPKNVRKIILATNVAETSITVEDVVHVVDTGLHRQHRFDVKRRLSSSMTEWISQSNAEQRAGRAGRVRSGFCYRLYTKERHDSMHEYPTPEILRAPLDKVLLDSKIFAKNKSALELFGHLPSPPKTNVIHAATEELLRLQLLDKNENLTRLGGLISQFPMAPRLAKAMVQSVPYECVTPVVDIATIFGTDSANIFSSALVDKQTIKETKQMHCTTSDHIALLLLFERWAVLIEDGENQEAMNFCREYNLLPHKLHTLRKLRDIHFQYLESSFHNMELSDECSDNEEIIKGVLFSGVCNALVHRSWDMVKGRLKRSNNIVTSGGHKATITPESVNSKTTNRRLFYLYINEIRSELRRSVLVRETSQIQPITMLLFHHGQLIYKRVPGDGKVVLKIEHTKIEILCTEKEAKLIEDCRKVLRNCEEHFIRHYTSNNHDTQPLTHWNIILKVLMKTLQSEKTWY